MFRGLRHASVFSVTKRGIFMRFAIGDLIIYGETGVCRVDDIVEKEFLGEVRPCYKLAPLYQSCMIFTPADVESVYMRPIITKNEADELIDSIANIEPAVCEVTSPRALSEKYDAIIKQHDCSALISLTKHIYNKRERMIAAKKKLSAVDERYLKRAEDLLFSEIAAALSIEKSQTRQYIEEKTK